MDSARKFVDKGQIDKAVKEYLRIVHEDPKDVRVWLKIGDLYAKKGSKQEATDTYLKVARFYHEQGFFLKAVAVYKQILKLDPRLVDVILKLAELYRQLGLMSDAMQHFESVAAHFHREGNTKEALATVKKLVDLDPENIATRIKLAELYSKESLVEEAVTEFSVACEQLRRQGRQDDFVKVAERLLWHKPDNHALNRELAGLYLRRNDPRRALQKLQACFKADPRDVETLGLLAQAFQALDQKSKTVSVLKELARIHLENKQRDKAVSVYRKITEFMPNDPDAAQFFGSSPGQPAAAAAPSRPAPMPPPAPFTPPPPPVRPATALPDAIRMAAADPQFNITGDMPSIPPSARMTGAMPLVDDQSLSGIDFALPEYDDADFSADMEPPPDRLSMSAAGERHAEEISKILAETDVYVKYGLHQKAVDHLRRVFLLDTDNVEAHERLKDIFVSQGREQEAELELLKLAETVASTDPDRAESYLQELLAMNGTHTGAFELARKFRLRVARMSSVSAEVEYAGGGVAAVDVDLDELDLNSRPIQAPLAMGIARGVRRDSIDDFDPDELIGNGVAHGSPAPGRPPSRPRPRETDDYGLDFAPSPAHATRQMSPEHVDALANQTWNGSLEDAVDAQLDDDAIGVEIDNEVGAELHANDEDLAFDPDEARAFDAAVRRDQRSYSGQPPSPQAQQVNFDEQTDLPAVRHAIEAAGFENIPSVATDAYDQYPNEDPTPPVYDPTASHTLAQTIDHGQVDLDPHDLDPHALDPHEIEANSRAESLVEDDLDEADFYTGQGMYNEAREVLVGLLERYPNHPLIHTKLRDVETMAATHAHVEPHHAQQGLEISLDDDPGHAHEGLDASDGTEAIELDEIEEVDATEFEEIDSSIDAPSPMGDDDHSHGHGRRKPSVMLEKPVDEGDAETHYDLGLAYKEMGLYDEAIKAFEKTLRAPGREVQCRVMIGMCHREHGNPSEAIHQFKQGLHADPIDRERLSLYYEIGVTYEAIGDEAEALYYFESVTKRDPGFADAALRADQLRARVGQGAHHDDDL